MGNSDTYVYSTVIVKVLRCCYTQITGGGGGEGGEGGKGVGVGWGGMIFDLLP